MSGGVAAVGGFLATYGTAISAAAAVGSLAMTAINGQKQEKAQSAALNQSTAAASTAQTAASQAENQANAQGPDTAAIEARNMINANAGPNGPAGGAKGGGGATMLSGPTGVDPASLNLGKNTLLGST